MKNILITGSLGQIGSELIVELRKRYGAEHVIATDIRQDPPAEVRDNGIYEVLDCNDSGKMNQLVSKYKVDTIYHLAALLSAVAEAKPQLAWEINMGGLVKILEIAREHNCAVFTPSSIGAFGPTTPPDNTPQDTIQRPTTMYGVTKVAGELLCDYYNKRFGLDTRGVRFPGLISNLTPPGGGTTDYSVHIYYEAVKHKKYTCYIKKGTYMDMMYMPDAVECMIKVMEADASKLKHRNAFNVTSMSFEPEQIAAAIRKHIPEFTMDYNVDPIRQGIADSWPNSLNAKAAREEWGFNPKYNLETMTTDMIRVISEKHKKGLI